jgi:hypothetical protein
MRQPQKRLELLGCEPGAGIVHGHGFGDSGNVVAAKAAVTVALLGV